MFADGREDFVTYPTGEGLGFGFTGAENERVKAGLGNVGHLVKDASTGGDCPQCGR